MGHGPAPTNALRDCISRSVCPLTLMRFFFCAAAQRFFLILHFLGSRVGRGWWVAEGRWVAAADVNNGNDGNGNGNDGNGNGNDGNELGDTSRPLGQRAQGSHKPCGAAPPHSL